MKKLRKVYIVMLYGWDSGEIRGVFSSRVKAENFVKDSKEYGLEIEVENLH